VFRKLAAFLIRRRWIVLAVLGAATVAGGVLAPFIDFDFSPQAVLNGSDDLVAHSEDFKRAFGYDDTAVLVVLEATGDRDVLDRRALTWQTEVARDLAGLPRVEDVRSLAVLRLPAPQVTDRPSRRNPLVGLSIKPVPLIGDLPVTEADEARIRRALTRASLAERMLFSPDKRLAATTVLLEPAARDLDSARGIVRDIEARLADRPVPGGYRLHLSGLPVVRTDIVENLQADLHGLLPLAAGTFLVVLTLLFRRVSGALLPVLAVGAGLAWTFGILVATGERLNIISNILPVLLFVIGMANCVHIVSRYAEEAERSGGDLLAAGRGTISHMASACLLTYLTTAIGFTTLIAARSDAVQSVGWQALMGMMLLYISTVFLLGCALPSFRAPRHTHATTAAAHPIARLVSFTGHAVARRPWVTLAASALVVATALLLARNVRIDTRMVGTYDTEHPVIRTMRMLEERMGGLMAIEVDLRADRPGRFLEPEVFAAVRDVQSAAGGYEEVILTRSYADICDQVLKNLPFGASGGAPPTAPQLALADRVVGTMPETVGLPMFLTDDGRRARLMIRVRDLGTTRILDLIRRLEDQLATHFPADGPVTARLTGDAYLHAVGFDRFVRDFFYSLVAAAGVIFVVIAVLFRSIRLGLISILPNTTPLLLTLGYIGARGYDLNAANVVVFAISLGIAVDDSIHFLARFREEVRHDAHVLLAIRRAFRGAGRAIVLTSVLIISGISALLLSRFVPSRRFAELTSVTMAAALVGDLLLLPACLVLFWRRGRPPLHGPTRAAKPEPGAGQGAARREDAPS